LSFSDPNPRPGPSGSFAGCDVGLDNRRVTRLSPDLRGASRLSRLHKQNPSEFISALHRLPGSLFHARE
jgi:hypothetical protein